MEKPKGKEMSMRPDVGTVVIEWAKRQGDVKALVLFGSQARATQTAASADSWSDVDLHLITSSPHRFENKDWVRALPELDLCLYVVRPASGGVRKATLVFSTGEVDLVIVPVAYMRRIRRAARLGLYLQQQPLRYVLNEFSTIMGYGYRFLKGERHWGAFYAWAVAKMPGQRLNDREAIKIAEVFLSDLLSMLQRIERGELVSSQRIFHLSLVETNFRLLHEARLRRNVVTYREARRVERLLLAEELALIKMSAGCVAAELHNAAWHVYHTLCVLMTELAPNWRVPASFEKLLSSHRSLTESPTVMIAIKPPSIAR